MVQTILSDPKQDRWIVIWQSNTDDSDQQHLYIAIDQSRGRIVDISDEKEEMREN